MRPGRTADHSLPSSATVMEEYSYTSTHSLGHTGPVTGSLYLYLYHNIKGHAVKLLRHYATNRKGSIPDSVTGTFH